MQALCNISGHCNHDRSAEYKENSIGRCAMLCVRCHQPTYLGKYDRLHAKPGLSGFRFKRVVYKILKNNLNS